MSRRMKMLLTAVAYFASLHLAEGQMNPKEKMAAAMKTIQDNYVDSIPEEKLTDAAIGGMLQVLDPHSKYFNREEAQQMQETMSGSFSGIGIQYLMERDTVFVTQVTPGGPAEKTGILAGDGIIAIDSKLLAGQGLSNYAIMKMLRGERGSTVAVQVWRRTSGTLFTAAIIRNSIPDRSVRSAYMVNGAVGFISLRMFNQTTRKEVDSALQRLKEEGMQSLILDLQGNGGGLVQEAIGVADEFLQKDRMVFYSVGNDHGKDYYYTGGFGRFPEGRLVVLIDQNTASAAEILSGALQDWDRAVLVGRRSFGKGLMQKGFRLADGSVLELTGARYYTPSGRSIQKPYHGARYEDNTATRLASGELVNASVIHFPDSLAFATLVSKRKVYGGGGIMPDRYIPIDTAQYNGWLQAVSGSGWIHETVFAYVDSNRQRLKGLYPTFPDFQGRFVVPEYLFPRLAVKAREAGMFPEMPLQVRRILDLEMKGMIASQLYGSNQYYDRVVNTGNESFQQAMSIISDSKQYAYYLKGEQNGAHH